MPYKKKIVIILILLLVVSNLYSSSEPYNLELENWIENKVLSGDGINTGGIIKYKKTLKETNIIIPNSMENRVLYLTVNNHRGYSKIFFNDEFIGDFGKSIYIRGSKEIPPSTISIPGSLIKKSSVNNIKIRNYSKRGQNSTKFYLSSINEIDRVSKFYIFEILTISQLLIVLLYLFSFLNFKDKMVGEDSDYVKIHTVFIFFLIFSMVKYHDTLLTPFTHLSVPYLIIGWLLILHKYLVNEGLWRNKKYPVIGFIYITTVLSFYILNNEVDFLPDTDTINSIFLLVANVFGIKIISNNTEGYNKRVNQGITFNIIVTSLYSIILISTGVKIPLFLEIGGTLAIVGYNLSLRSKVYEKIKSGEQYNKKLEDSISKEKIKLQKKEIEISELKSLNDEIQREKTLFFSTLSNNLRTPLNSIIGYSENLYTSNDINEVHSAVTDIIVESDRIYQIINNITDFSTRNFSSSDLLLKDFTMEEIFNNSLSESPNISSFSKYIEYRAIGNCDKVKINANPLIFKQVITSLLHFLIELNPRKINYTIFDSGFDNSFIHLELKLAALDLNKSELAFISTISNYKDTFTKYINLYNVEFDEEMGDDYYSFHLKLRCTLSSQNSSQKKQEKFSSLVLKQQLNVMVVEDYEPNLNIVKMHLDKMGCNVYTATNGSEAVEKFKENSIDVILMDIKMPIMNGWEATEKIRELDRGLNTFIIGLTASSLDLDIRHCFESGMDDVQVKPIRKKQLYAKLNSLDKIKPVVFPTIGSLRAELSISKLESETLYTTSVNQIEKQLEVIEVLISAGDDTGIDKEIPSLIHASLNINAFYYTRILRNFYYSYKNGLDNYKELLEGLKTILKEAKEVHSDLFRD